MISPFKGKFRLTSPRGKRLLCGKYEYHPGIDIVGLQDTNIYACADGVVYTLFEKDGFGNYIRQELSDGKRLYYGHMKRFCVKNATKVKKGDLIGVMGSTGRAFGDHLHLELRPSGSANVSLDISMFTGIPNSTGVYDADRNIFSYDNTVDELVSLGIVSAENMANWEMMLDGRASLRAEYVRTVFDRLCKKIREASLN